MKSLSYDGIKVKMKIVRFLKLLLLLSDGFIIAFLALFILWKLDVELHPGIIAAIIAGTILFSWVSYIIFWPALADRKTSDSMIDLEGVVVKPLSPEGVIKIRGELWNAVSCNGQAITSAVE